MGTNRRNVMRLNRRLLSFFFPFAFVFGTVAFVIPSETGGKFLAICAGVCQALTFTVFAWKLGTDAQEEGFHFPWIPNNILVFASWIILAFASTIIAMRIYVGWLLVILGVASLIALSVTKTLRVSKQWILIGDGNTLTLNPPANGIELFWWQEPAVLSLIPRESKITLAFAILAELPLGLQVDMLAMNCHVVFVSGYHELPSKTYKAVLADIAEELSEEIQAGVSTKLNQSGQYDFVLPSDLLSVEGRRMDRFGYRMQVSLLHAV